MNITATTNAIANKPQVSSFSSLLVYLTYPNPFGSF